MDGTIIKIQNLSKRYIIGHQSGSRGGLPDGLRHRIEAMVRNPLRWWNCWRQGKKQACEEFWALKDVSFEVPRSETLAVIGRNGAGKSTMLKILSRIVEPTAGRVEIDGRIASLLEVGTGFHQELTGRENIFLNGAILGMTRAEILKKFDEIVAFSEVERFLDTPVKRYSSGMYVRLAFAVAAHLEPEILIVDEVLAVGDAQFQKKCLGKMQDVSSHEGRTVLFVSHNMGAVTSLCRKACWLERGAVRQMGTAREVVNGYLAQKGQDNTPFVDLVGSPRHPNADGRIRIQSLEWLSSVPLQHGVPVNGRIRMHVSRPVEEVSVGVGFSTVEGTRLLSYDTDLQGERLNLKEAKDYSVDFELGPMNLAPGVYSLDIGCRSGDNHGLDYLPAAIQVEIIPGPTTPGFIIRPEGGVRMPSRWKWGP